MQSPEQAGKAREIEKIIQSLLKIFLEEHFPFSADRRKLDLAKLKNLLETTEMSILNQPDTHHMTLLHYLILLAAAYINEKNEALNQITILCELLMRRKIDVNPQPDDKRQQDFFVTPHFLFKKLMPGTRQSDFLYRALFNAAPEVYLTRSSLISIGTDWQLTLHTMLTTNSRGVSSEDKIYKALQNHYRAMNRVIEARQVRMEQEEGGQPSSAFFRKG